MYCPDAITLGEQVWHCPDELSLGWQFDARFEQQYSVLTVGAFSDSTALQWQFVAFSCWAVFWWQVSELTDYHLSCLYFWTAILLYCYSVLRKACVSSFMHGPENFHVSWQFAGRFIVTLVWAYSCHTVPITFFCADELFHFVQVCNCVRTVSRSSVMACCTRECAK